MARKTAKVKAAQQQVAHQQKVQLIDDQFEALTNESLSGTNFDALQGALQQKLDDLNEAVGSTRYKIGSTENTLDKDKDITAVTFTLQISEDNGQTWIDRTNPIRIENTALIEQKEREAQKKLTSTAKDVVRSALNLANAREQQTTATANAKLAQQNAEAQHAQAEAAKKQKLETADQLFQNYDQANINTTPFTIEAIQKQVDDFIANLNRMVSDKLYQAKSTPIKDDANNLIGLNINLQKEEGSQFEAQKIIKLENTALIEQKQLAEAQQQIAAKKAAAAEALQAQDTKTKNSVETFAKEEFTSQTNLLEKLSKFKKELDYNPRYKIEINKDNVNQLDLIIDGETFHTYALNIAAATSSNQHAVTAKAKNDSAEPVDEAKMTAAMQAEKDKLEASHIDNYKADLAKLKRLKLKEKIQKLFEQPNQVIANTSTQALQVAIDLYNTKFNAAGYGITIITIANNPSTLFTVNYSKFCASIKENLTKGTEESQGIAEEGILTANLALGTALKIMLATNTLVDDNPPTNNKIVETTKQYNARIAKKAQQKAEAAEANVVYKVDEESLVKAYKQKKIKQFKLDKPDALSTRHSLKQHLKERTQSDIKNTNTAKIDVLVNLYNEAYKEHGFAVTNNNGKLSFINYERTCREIQKLLDKGAQSNATTIKQLYNAANLALGTDLKITEIQTLVDDNPPPANNKIVETTTKYEDRIAKKAKQKAEAAQQEAAETTPKKEKSVKFDDQEFSYTTGKPNSPDWRRIKKYGPVSSYQVYDENSPSNSLTNAIPTTNTPASKAILKPQLTQFHYQIPSNLPLILALVNYDNRAIITALLALVTNSHKLNPTNRLHALNALNALASTAFAYEQELFSSSPDDLTSITTQIKYNYRGIYEFFKINEQNQIVASPYFTSFDTPFVKEVVANFSNEIINTLVNFNAYISDKSSKDYLFVLYDYTHDNQHNFTQLAQIQHNIFTSNTFKDYSKEKQKDIALDINDFFEDTGYQFIYDEEQKTYVIDQALLQATNAKAAKQSQIEVQYQALDDRYKALLDNIPSMDKGIVAIETYFNDAIAQLNKEFDAIRSMETDVEAIAEPKYKVDFVETDKQFKVTLAQYDENATDPKYKSKQPLEIVKVRKPTSSPVTAKAKAGVTPSQNKATPPTAVGVLNVQLERGDATTYDNIIENFLDAQNAFRLLPADATNPYKDHSNIIVLYNAPAAKPYIVIDKTKGSVNELTIAQYAAQLNTYQEKLAAAANKNKLNNKRTSKPLKILELLQKLLVSKKSKMKPSKA